MESLFGFDETFDLFVLEQEGVFDEINGNSDNNNNNEEEERGDVND